MSSPLSRSLRVAGAAERASRSRGAFNQADQGIGLVLFAALFFAVFYQDALLAALLGISLAMVAITGFFVRFGGRRLNLSVRVRPRRVFPGQTATLEIAVRNPEPMPLPWLNVLVNLPRSIELPELHVQRSPTAVMLSMPLSLGGRQHFIRRTTAYLTRRGLHRLGPVDALIADPFGIRQSLRKGREASSILVYPRVRPLDAELRRSLPIGDRRGHSFLDDESRYLGPRAYQPTDSPNRIDWYQSARRGDLFVKTYETVATAATALFLDPTTGRDPWDGIDHAVLEETVEITASLANDLIRRGQATGLYISGVFSEHAGRRAFSYREPPRTGARQLSHLLEALAQVRPPGIFRNLPRILAEEVPHLPYHVHIVVITPYLSHELQHALLRTARNHRTYWLATGQADPQRDATVPPNVRPLHLLSR